MLRKNILAVTATAALAVAALAVTSDFAFAKKHGGGKPHHHRHHHHSFRVFSPPVYAGYDTCMRKRWVATPYGMRLRWVNVCAY